MGNECSTKADCVVGKLHEDGEYNQTKPMKLVDFRFKKHENEGFSPRNEYYETPYHTENFEMHSISHDPYQDQGDKLDDLKTFRFKNAIRTMDSLVHRPKEKKEMRYVEVVTVGKTKDMNPLSPNALTVYDKLGPFSLKDAKNEPLGQDRKDNPTYGPYRYEDGTTYTGQFYEGEKEGNGIETTPDGEIYEGQFSGGVRSGQGRLVMKTGDVLQGVFVKGMVQGKAKLVLFETGNTIEGEFRDNRPHGVCEEIDQAGKVVYKGDYSEGVRSGHGSIKFEDGGLYEGEFKEGVFHGKGKLDSDDFKVMAGGGHGDHEEDLEDYNFVLKSS